MITVKHITKLEELGPIIFDQELDESVGRYRSNCLYKGLNNEKWELSTSLYRNCHYKKSELELTILRSFTKYASFEDPQLMHSVWRQLIIGQHHGLPTRMLDWTYSPLIGLHFATSNDPEKLGTRNVILWKIDIDEINSLLPTSYKKVLEDERAYLFTVEMLQKCTRSLATYDQSMKDQAMVLLEPPSIDERIVNQYANFAIIPEGIEPSDGSYSIERWLNDHTEKTVKYVIEKDLVWRIRDMLDQMNINERTSYPGLDGLSQWLKRHYYVI